MFELNKISQLAILSTDTTVEEGSRLLEAEGFYAGYKPVSEVKNITFSQCLKKRIPNYYFMQHGGIEDLCVGGEAVTPIGRHFTLKTAPRSATGPDLRRMLVGSDDLFGSFKIATMRIFPLPENTVWGFCLMEHVSEVHDFLKLMLNSFIRPLFTCVLDDEDSEKLMQELGRSSKGKVIMAFKLSGLRGLLEAQKETIIHFGETLRHSFYWPNRIQDTLLLDEALMTARIFRSFVRKHAELLHHGIDIESLAEKKLGRAVGELRAR